MRNEPDAIAAWFGVWQAGATFVPINPRVPPAERERADRGDRCVGCGHIGATRGIGRG